MNKIKYGGAILDIDERDYILGGKNGIDIEELPQIQSTIIEYNQLEFEKDYGNCLCTTYAGLGMLSNNSGKKINSVGRLNHCMIRSKLPDFDIKVGGLLSEGIKSVIDIEQDGIMYRIHKSNVLKLNEKGYTVNIGIYVGNDLKLAGSDGKITSEEIEKIIDNKRGHSTLTNANKDWQDSYVGVKEYNITKINNLEKFINSWIVYDWAYLIIPNNIIKQIFKSKLTGNKKRDINLGVELMKQKQIYPREFVVYQELLQETYIGKKIA